jgi:phosphoenolpyruvate-protein phosphotransferase
MRQALEQVKSALLGAAQGLQSAGAAAEAGILEAQALMLEDPAVLEAAFALLGQGVPADRAVAQSLEPFAAMLRASDDPVFRARAADVDDVSAQVARALHGVDEVPAAPDQPSILVADDLAPSQTARLDRDRVVGFATEQGSATAHTAILARALGLPAVVGISGVLQAVSEGQLVLLDGDQGTLLLDPSSDAVVEVAPPLGLVADPEPAVTRDGRRLEIACNAAGVDDARRAAAAGADGIGLLRSEFLFMDRDTLPSEEEQVTILDQVVAALGGRSVILRTLDVGADKPLPALPQPAEANPALGVRGLRLHLMRRPDLLRAQLSAAVRVAARRPLRVMFPMVSTVDEVRQAKALLEDVQRSIGVPEQARIEVGIMIEVPAAAVAADLLAPEVDFFSLGTNDLAQYLFAADRTNPEVAPLADSLQPALLRMIGQVVKAAHQRRRWVGLCGEMASDPWALPLLVGLGLDELSVHPPVVARIKARVRTLDAAACSRVARAAQKLDSPAAVRRLLERRRLSPG